MHCSCILCCSLVIVSFVYIVWYVSQREKVKRKVTNDYVRGYPISDFLKFVCFLLVT